MLYRLLADAVMLAHFGFLLFLVLGGFLAWRHRWVLVPHIAAVGWAALSVAGMDCPLTAWEDDLRRLAGEQGLPARLHRHLPDRGRLSRRPTCAPRSSSSPR